VGTLPASELARISLGRDELSEWRFVAPDFLGAHFNDRLLRRIRTALTAHERGQPAYAEHGNEAHATA
jgi:8-oxo-dGTP diphosphatase